MSDLRASLEEAFPDDVEEPVSEVIQAEEEVPAEEPEGEGDLGSGSDADVESGSDTEVGEEVAAAPEPSGGDDSDSESPAGEAVATEAGTKPPIGWAADAREEWSKIPPAAQAQIDKREKEMAQAMAHTSEAKKTHAELQQMAQTYGAVMAAEGASDPLQAINGLMQSVAQLRMGSPAQKAQKMAALISHYGVDINALDAALVGEEPVAGETSQFEHLLEQKLAPVNEMMNNLAGLQQQQNVQVNESAQAEVNEFAKTAEFINDVRVDMADILDLAEKRGQSMTLKEAYDRACIVNPQVSKVIAARNAAEAQKKMNASSSIVGRGQVAPNTKEESIGDTLRRLMTD